VEKCSTLGVYSTRPLAPFFYQSPLFVGLPFQNECFHFFFFLSFFYWLHLCFSRLRFALPCSRTEPTHESSPFPQPPPMETFFVNHHPSKSNVRYVSLPGGGYLLRGGHPRRPLALPSTHSRERAGRLLHCSAALRRKPAPAPIAEKFSALRFPAGRRLDSRGGVQGSITMLPVSVITEE
jgi:hypothetical protein